MNVYQRIDRELRKQKGNWKALAKSINVPYSSLMSAYKRNSIMTTERLQAIASTLNVPITRLAGYNDLILMGMQQEFSNETTPAPGMIDLLNLLETLDIDLYSGNPDDQYRYEDMFDCFISLTKEGKDKAIEYMSDLLKIDAYVRKDITPITPEEVGRARKRLMSED